MAATLKTKILVWGRAGAHCAFPACNRNLVMDASETDDESLVGDVAHIVAESSDGPRGNSQLSLAERDLYANLVLLCKIHHKLVDDQEDTYPVALLHQFKSEHEGRVRAALTPADMDLLRDRQAIASIVQEWMRLAEIDNWLAWTSFMLGANGPALRAEQEAELQFAVTWILNRVWPQGFPSLRAALENFGRILNDTLLQFNKHSERRGNDLHTTRFYQIGEWDPERYDELAEQYEEHCDFVRDLTLELTRSANLVCDSVRRSLDPSFRVTEGVLLVQSGPHEDFTFRTRRIEYRPSERTERPYPGISEFRHVRFSRDFAFGRQDKA